MKLQILVPQYKENYEIIKNLLDSINLQQGVDFKDIGVIIVNDGSDVILDSFVGYKFNIDYYLSEHRGVSFTRNFALDKSSADYVMWCDADDMFVDLCGIYNILNQIDEGFDVFYSKFTEQLCDSFSYRENDRVFVHGKVFNRKYLVDNNIRFNDDLTIHEDHYFVVLSMSCTNNIKYCYDSFYLWKYRKDSVARECGKSFVYNTYEHLINSDRALVNELISRNKIIQAQRSFVQMIYDSYFEFMKPIWDTDKEYKNHIKNCIKDYYLENYNLINTFNKYEKLKLIQGIRNRVFITDELTDVNILFDDWIKYILS